MKKLGLGPKMILSFLVAIAGSVVICGVITYSRTKNVLNSNMQLTSEQTLESALNSLQTYEKTISLPVDLLYTGVLNLIAFVLFKTNKTVTDEGLEEEYDSDEDKYEQLLRRRKAIEELAATLDDEKEPAGQEYHGEKMDQDEDTVSEHMDRHEGSSQVAGLDVDIEEDNFDLPEETVEEERELTLEELMQELEAATREMQKQNPPEEVKK